MLGRSFPGHLHTGSRVEVAGEAGTAAEAARIAHIDADVIAVDLVLSDGLNAIRNLRGRNSAAKILALTTTTSERQVIQAIEAGADGTCRRDASYTTIIDALERLSAGETLITPEELEELRLSTLTAKELEALQVLADGVSIEEAAVRMGIAIETVRSHLVNTRRKLAVHSTLQAVILAIRHCAIDVKLFSPKQPRSSFMLDMDVRRRQPLQFAEAR